MKNNEEFLLHLFDKCDSYFLVRLNHDKDEDFRAICEVSGAVNTGGCYMESNEIKNEIGAVFIDLVTGKTIFPHMLKTLNLFNRGLTYTVACDGGILKISNKIVVFELNKFLNDDEMFNNYVKHIENVEDASIRIFDDLKRNSYLYSGDTIKSFTFKVKSKLK